MEYKVCLTRFVETPHFRHRLMLTLTMPFAPFPGLVFWNITAGPTAELDVAKVVYNPRPRDGQPDFDCILSDKKADRKLDDVYLYSHYGSEWKFDGIPLNGG